MAICSMPGIGTIPQLSRDEYSYLNSDNSLTRRIYVMEEMLSLTRDEHYERDRIVDDLYNLLKPYYPVCNVLVYGSSANGFGLRGCDLDLLFLPFPEYCNIDFKDKGKGVVPSPYHVLKGTQPKPNLYCMSEEMHLQFVQRIMYTTKRYFRKVFLVPAKCPILNIEFVNSPISCDFSASNRLVVYNTELLWVFGRLHRYVRPLVIFLRYWAKCLGFISKSLFSSYCFTLLVIFYLQNTKPPVLPSVRQLKELAGYSRIVDGWETAICRLSDYTYKCENTDSLSQLLINFFYFYWEFDFIQNIVCPYEGKPLSVKELKESKNERIKEFQVTPFSIQDPFILSKNLSRNSTMKTPFKLALLLAKELLFKKNIDFQLLFDLTYYQKENTLLYAPTKASLPSGSLFFTQQLTYEVYQKLALTSQLKPWFEKVTQSILDILQFGLFLDCEVVDKVVSDDETLERPAKRKKLYPETMGNLKRIISIQCVANFPTLWKRNRVQVFEHLSQTKTDLKDIGDEIEIPACLNTDYKISQEFTKDEIKSIIKLPNDDSKPPYFSFTCNCFQYPELQIADIVISFSPLTNKKVFNEIKDYLKAFTRKHIKSILEEM